MLAHPLAVHADNQVLQSPPPRGSHADTATSVPWATWLLCNGRLGFPGSGHVAIHHTL